MHKRQDGAIDLSPQQSVQKRKPMFQPIKIQALGIMTLSLLAMGCLEENPTKPHTSISVDSKKSSLTTNKQRQTPANKPKRTFCSRNSRKSGNARQKTPIQWKNRKLRVAKSDKLLRREKKRLFVKGLLAVQGKHKPISPSPTKAKNWKAKQKRFQQRLDALKKRYPTDKKTLVSRLKQEKANVFGAQTRK